MRYKTATQWGVYEVDVLDGQISGVHGIAADPEPADIRNTLLDGIQHEKRIRRPSVRKGWLQDPDRARAKRGIEEFR